MRGGQDSEGGAGQVIRMSFAQERMWFLEQLSPDTAFYNIPMVLRLRGGMRVEALSGALQDVVNRHEGACALR